MRLAALALMLCLLAALGVCADDPPAAARDRPWPVLPNPDLHTQAAARFLEVAFRDPRKDERQGVLPPPLGPECDRQYVVFFSFWYVPEQDLTWWRQLLGVWVHQLTFEAHVSLPQEVPGTGGRLLWLDRRNYDWSAEAWLAVASRDPRCREPWVFHGPAESLRRLTGYGHVSAEAARTQPDTVPVVGLVDGVWFLRETMETRRSPSYYDLLFSRFRFVKGGEKAEEFVERKEQVVEKVVYHPGGDFVHPPGSKYAGRVTANVRPGNYTVEFVEGSEQKRQVQVPAAKFVDFPKDEKDWERAFGIDAARAFARDARIDIDFGAIVEGGRDHPKTGSAVTLNNRLIAVIDGPIAPEAKTFDVKETSGERDFSEVLIFRNGKFVRGQGVQAIFDASERLAWLPGGGQAGALFNDKGQRIEVAAGDFANDAADKRLNQGVRTVGSCCTCHASTGGWIPPRNREERAQKAGIKRKFRSREQELRYYQFFDALDERMESAQKRFQRLVARASVIPGEPKKVWTGADFALAIGKARDRYDDPVDKARGARELGLPQGVFDYLLSRSPKQRPLDLLQGLEIPSRTWEVDTYKDVGLLLAAFRNDPEFEVIVKRVLIPREK